MLLSCSSTFSCNLLFLRVFQAMRKKKKRLCLFCDMLKIPFPENIVFLHIGITKHKEWREQE